MFDFFPPGFSGCPAGQVGPEPARQLHFTLAHLDASLVFEPHGFTAEAGLRRIREGRKVVPLLLWCKGAFGKPSILSPRPKARSWEGGRLGVFPASFLCCLPIPTTLPTSSPWNPGSPPGFSPLPILPCRPLVPPLGLTAKPPVCHLPQASLHSYLLPLSLGCPSLQYCRRCYRRYHLLGGTGPDCPL